MFTQNEEQLSKNGIAPPKGKLSKFFSHSIDRAKAL